MKTVKYKQGEEYLGLYSVYKNEPKELKVKISSDLGDITLPLNRDEASFDIDNIDVAKQFYNLLPITIQFTAFLSDEQYWYSDKIDYFNNIADCKYIQYMGDTLGYDPKHNCLAVDSYDNYIVTGKLIHLIKDDSRILHTIFPQTPYGKLNITFSKA